ncbi:MAG: hypothetical protein HYV13_03975 [Candidatus Doudnabacteria bacterium]|nr:hypothetical protein [Candidatus Doudnabacteria bacterium]
MKWIRFFTRGNHPILYVYWVMESLRREFGDYFGLPNLKHWARHSGSLWVEERELKLLLQAIKKKLGTDWPYRALKKMKGDSEKLIVITKHTKHATKQNLKQIFDQAALAFQATYLPIMIDLVINEELKPVIEKVPLGKKPLMRQKYQQALRAVKKPNPEVFKKVFINYAWINSYVMDITPLTYETFKADWKSAKKNQIKAVQSQKTKINPRIDRLVAMAQEYIHFRDWRLYKISEFFYYFKPLLMKKAQGLSYEAARQLTPEELISGKFNRRILKLRQKDYGLMFASQGVKIIVGPKLQDFKKSIQDLNGRTSKIAGLIANKGRVTGRARVADAYNFSGIKSGEILITPETQPAAVPYLKKVKAIVTDEGGITSHAAIVSREMKIPCIIGTKIGTQVFKTGDLVEVDAQRGIVKLLKRAN